MIVGPWGLEGEHQGVAVDDAQASGGDGGANHVAAEPLKSASSGGLDAGGRMQGEAPGGIAQGGGADAVLSPKATTAA